MKVIFKLLFSGTLCSTSICVRWKYAALVTANAVCLYFRRFLWASRSYWIRSSENM